VGGLVAGHGDSDTNKFCRCIKPSFVNNGTCQTCSEGIPADGNYPTTASNGIKSDGDTEPENIVTPYCKCNAGCYVGKELVYSYTGGNSAGAQVKQQPKCVGECSTYHAYDAEMNSQYHEETNSLIFSNVRLGSIYPATGCFCWPTASQYGGLYVSKVRLAITAYNSYEVKCYTCSDFDADDAQETEDVIPAMPGVVPATGCKCRIDANGKQMTVQAHVVSGHFTIYDNSIGTQHPNPATVRCKSPN
jgi:hypothetical protein